MIIGTTVFKTCTVPAVADIATASEVDFREAKCGMIHVPAGSSITTLTFYVSDKIGGTYLPAYTEQNAAVALTVAASRAYPIPLSLNQVLSALEGAGAFKMIGNVAGTVNVSLKG